MGIEPMNRGFADLGLTTWLPRRNFERSSSSGKPRCQPQPANPGSVQTGGLTGLGVAVYPGRSLAIQAPPFREEGRVAGRSIARGDYTCGWRPLPREKSRAAYGPVTQTDAKPAGAIHEAAGAGNPESGTAVRDGQPPVVPRQRERPSAANSGGRFPGPISHRSGPAGLATPERQLAYRPRGVAV